ncbi:MAG TPA: hypothetical protein VK766_10435 [Cytophagaceae bacterium]|nr:hypothetical protein [Cytophagaceae bacterium]
MGKIKKGDNNLLVFNSGKMVTGIIFSLFGFSLIIAAIFHHQSIYFPIFAYSFGIPLVVFFMLFTGGTEFDLNKNKVRKYKVIFLGIGKWHSLIDFDKIVFREFSYINGSGKYDPVGGELKGFKEYQVYLTGSDKKPLKVCVYTNKKDAWNIAKRLAKKLGYELQVIHH